MASPHHVAKITAKIGGVKKGRQGSSPRSRDGLFDVAGGRGAFLDCDDGPIREVLNARLAHVRRICSLGFLVTPLGILVRLHHPRQSFSPRRLAVLFRDFGRDFFALQEAIFLLHETGLLRGQRPLAVLFFDADAGCAPGPNGRAGPRGLRDRHLGRGGLVAPRGDGPVGREDPIGGVAALTGVGGCPHLEGNLGLGEGHLLPDIELHGGGHPGGFGTRFGGGGGGARRRVGMPRRNWRRRGRTATRVFVREDQPLFDVSWKTVIRRFWVIEVAWSERFVLFGVFTQGVLDELGGCCCSLLDWGRHPFLRSTKRSVKISSSSGNIS